VKLPQVQNGAPVVDMFCHRCICVSSKKRPIVIIARTRRKVPVGIFSKAMCQSEDCVFNYVLTNLVPWSDRYAYPSEINKTNQSRCYTSELPIKSGASPTLLTWENRSHGNRNAPHVLNISLNIKIAKPGRKLIDASYRGPKPIRKVAVEPLLFK